MTRGKHRRRDYSPFECEWVTIKVVPPRNHFDDGMKMLTAYLLMLVFCLIIGSLVIW